MSKLILTSWSLLFAGAGPAGATGLITTLPSYFLERAYLALAGWLVAVLILRLCRRVGWRAVRVPLWVLLAVVAIDLAYTPYIHEGLMFSGGRE